MPHSYVPSCVVAHMDPHSPTQGRVVGGVACYLLNCVELFWKMYMLGTLACDYLCVILAIKNHQETLQKWHTSSYGNSQAVWVTMWLVKILQKCSTTSSYSFFFFEYLSHALATKNSELHTKSIYIHERIILNFFTMIIQNMSSLALITHYQLKLFDWIWHR